MIGPNYNFGLTLLSGVLHIFLSSHKGVEMQDRETFPDSKRGREKPFRMYNDNQVITVQLTDLEPGWRSEKTNIAQASYHVCFQK